MFSRCWRLAAHRRGENEELVVDEEVAGQSKAWWLQKDVDGKLVNSTIALHENQSESWKDDPPGENAYIRKYGVDYAYVGEVSLERVAMQDAVIRSHFERGVEATNSKKAKSFTLPWLVYTGGGMGAGKGYVVDWMNSKGYLPLHRMVTVDPDAIRAELPEWGDLSKKLPREAGYLTQREATNIGDILAKKALSKRLSVLIDGSLQDTEWYRGTELPRYRALFPGIRIMIIHVDADVDECIKRAAARAKEEGRIVPEEAIRSSLSKSRDSVDALAGDADFVIRVKNVSGKDPEIHAVEGGNPRPDQVSWNLVKLCFSQLKKSGSSIPKATIDAAIEQGILTRRVVETMDLDHDGSIDTRERSLAEKKAADWGVTLFEQQHGSDNDESEDQ